MVLSYIIQFSISVKRQEYQQTSDMKVLSPQTQAQMFLGSLKITSSRYSIATISDCVYVIQEYPSLTVDVLILCVYTYA